MKKRFTQVVGGLLLLLAGTAQAQTFPVDTLIKNGPLTNRINLVFVGDGYQANEMNTYLADVNRAVSSLFQQAPFTQYRQYFNVFAVRVVSAQSGTTHPRTATDCTNSSLPVSAPTTYLRTTFDNNSIHRAIVTNGQAALGAVLAASFPRYTKAIVLVNTREYGGTGGAAITMTGNNAAPEIMLHEMGHTFGLLADEYWAGPTYAAEKPNLTQFVNPVRWQSWVGTGSVGTFAHAESPTWYRPHQNCKMRFLNAPFCNVCRETLIESIHRYARPVDAISPDVPDLPNPTADQLFSLTLLPPTPNTLRTKWRLDGAPLAGNVTQVLVPRARLATGNHTVEAEVLDTTTASHSTTHRVLHRYLNTWDVVQTPTGTRLSTSSAEYTIETYPNPVAEALTLAYTLPRPAEVRLSLLDATGRRLKTLSHGRQPAGTYTYQLRTAETLNLRTAGTYTLVLDIDGRLFSQPIVKE